MSIFMKSCAFGTAAGAVLGLAALAVSENPGEQTNTVARGASLGLYAGIGFGLYTLYGTPGQRTADYSQNQIWLTPLTKDRALDGAQLNWASFSF